MENPVKEPHQWLTTTQPSRYGPNHTTGIVLTGLGRSVLTRWTPWCTRSPLRDQKVCWFRYPSFINHFIDNSLQEARRRVSKKTQHQHQPCRQHGQLHHRLRHHTRSPLRDQKVCWFRYPSFINQFHQTLSVGGAMAGGPTPAPAIPSTWSNAASTSVSPSAQLPSTPYATSRNTNTQKRTVQSLDWKYIIPKKKFAEPFEEEDFDFDTISLGSNTDWRARWYNLVLLDNFFS